MIYKDYNVRVFLSWSQRRSRAIAEIWRDFLPNVIQSVRTFISSVDLEAGVRWTTDLADALGDMDHGILCITPENKLEPWIHFEAGALSKNVGKAKVMPCLYQIPVAQLPPSLAQFNCRPCDRAGSWDIVTSINNDLKEAGLDAIRLKKAFDKHFPEFEAALGDIQPLSEQEQKGVTPEKTVEQMVAEILTMLQRPASPVRPQGTQVHSTIVVASQYDRIVQGIIEAVRQNAGNSTWMYLHREIMEFAIRWRPMLAQSLDEEIRSLATECTIVPLETGEGPRLTLLSTIERHAIATANQLKDQWFRTS